jgi:hypothetical protein
MVSAAKAFDREPPRRPLTDLEAIAEDFQWRYVDRQKTDQVIKYCGEASTLALAVQRAVEARDENGKHHNHQSKVDIGARRLFGRRIMNRFRAGRLPVDDFDEMYAKMDKIKPYGIGPVTVYDTAIRIAAYLDIEPTSVYMHAGVRQGMRALADAWFRVHEQHLFPGSYHLDKIPVREFPSPLHSMRADDVEDILCTYREVFDSW